jgi:hypothetical protein
LIATLRNKRTLLILDGFDGLGDAKTSIPRLLRHAPRLQVLVTSRTMLCLPEADEFVFFVGELAYPPVDSVADAPD